MSTLGKKKKKLMNFTKMSYFFILLRNLGYVTLYMAYEINALTEFILLRYTNYNSWCTVIFGKKELKCIKRPQEHKFLICFVAFTSNTEFVTSVPLGTFTTKDDWNIWTCLLPNISLSKKWPVLLVGLFFMFNNWHLWHIITMAGNTVPYYTITALVLTQR